MGEMGRDGRLGRVACNLGGGVLIMDRSVGRLGEGS